MELASGQHPCFLGLQWSHIGLTEARAACATNENVQGSQTKQCLSAEMRTAGHTKGPDHECSEHHALHKFLAEGQGAAGTFSEIVARALDTAWQNKVVLWQQGALDALSLFARVQPFAGSCNFDGPLPKKPSVKAATVPPCATARGIFLFGRRCAQSCP